MDMEKIIGLVTKTKELIKNREMAAHVKEKGVADYVTQVDIAVQNFLKKELFLLAPDIQFLGEETGLQEMKADSFWILNPVDGTTNLMHDYQHSVVSLALCYQDEIVIDVYKRQSKRCYPVRYFEAYWVLQFKKNFTAKRNLS